MRATGRYTEALFSMVRLQDFVPSNHPLRPIRAWVNEAVAKMDGQFSAMYDTDIKGGRPSIAPEKMMSAMLLQALIRLRSER
jgi:transposase